MKQVRFKVSLRAAGWGLAAVALGVTSAPAALASSTLSQTSGAAYQTNGRVSDALTVGGTTYLAGSFTSVRPPGSSASSTGVSRRYLAAVDSTTGALRSWSPAASGPVYALAASPDGRTIYAGGDFGSVNGKRRRHLAALLASTGSVTAFRADTVGQVRALAVSDDRIYVGGTFTSVSGQARSRLAAVSPSGALAMEWKPAADDTVRVISLSPDGRSVYAGGDFGAVDGATAQKHLVKLSTTTGAAQPWTSHPGYPVWSIIATSSSIYVGGDGSGGHAGSYTAGGASGWVTQTDGGVQALALLNGVLYIGGHFDNVCVGDIAGATTGFQCPKASAVRHKLVAVDAATGATEGWNPGANSALGVFALDATGGRLRVGGVFTILGGRAQQGYGAFSQ